MLIQKAERAEIEEVQEFEAKLQKATAVSAAQDYLKNKRED